MLNRSSHDQAVAAQEGDEINLAGGLDFLRRQRFVIGAVLAGSLTMGVLYALAAPPQYTAKLQLMIDNRKVQPFSQQSAIVSELGLDTTAVDSQVEVLKSEAVRMAVVRKLQLAEDPEFVGSATSLIGASAAAMWRLVGGADEPSSESLAGLRQRALKRLAANLAVQRVGRTYVLEISYTSLDAHKAGRIANEVGEAYIVDQLQSNFDATKRASDWLQVRLVELREDATRADRAVQVYKAEHNLIGSDPGTGRTVTEQQLSELNTQLVQARAQVAEAKARLDRISSLDIKTIADPNDPLDRRIVSDALQNQTIVKVQSQYLDNARRIADFSARYGADHSAVVNLVKENDLLRAAAREELSRIAEAYRSDYEIAKSRRESLDASLKAIIELTNSGTEARVDLRMLESSAQSYRTLYDSFLQRFADSTQQQSFPKTEARVITPAPVGEKSQPKTPLVLGGALLLGLLGGVGAGFVREKLDRVLRTSRQVEDWLNVECLGVLPAIDDKEVRRHVAEAANLPRAPLTAASLPLHLGLERQVVHAPFSRFTETMRSVKVAADMTARAGDHLVLGVVSALPGEGKSTVAVNLAQVLTNAGNKVLLIDGDLRHPALTKRMTPGAEAGLLQVLDGSRALADLLWQDPLTTLAFLPAVLARPIAHTAELLASPQMERLLQDARATFKYVVIDLPPLAPVVDAKAVAELVDKFVLVVEWGATSPSIINETLGSAEVVRGRMLGAVLNKTDLAAMKRIEPYKGDGYYDYYYSSKAG